MPDVSVKDKSLWVAVPAELDHHSADGLCRRIDDLVRNRDIREIVFDFSKTVFCDSSGVGMLMGRYKIMRALGGSVRATSVGESVARILTLSGVTKIIAVECRGRGEAQ